MTSEVAILALWGKHSMTGTTVYVLHAYILLWNDTNIMILMPVSLPHSFTLVSGPCINIFFSLPWLFQQKSIWQPKLKTTPLVSRRLQWKGQIEKCIHTHTQHTHMHAHARTYINYVVLASPYNVQMPQNLWIIHNLACTQTHVFIRFATVFKFVTCTVEYDLLSFSLHHMHTSCTHSTRGHEWTLHIMRL